MGRLLDRIKSTQPGAGCEVSAESEESPPLGSLAWEDAAAWRLLHHTNERIVSHLLPPGDPWDTLWWERSEAMTARDWPRLIRVCAAMIEAAA